MTEPEPEPELRDDWRTVWVGDIPISLAFRTEDEQKHEAVALARDEGTLSANRNARIVRLLEDQFGPVEHAVVRVKPKSAPTGRNDDRERHRRCWALVTFRDEESADNAVADGLRVPDGRHKVAVRIRPSNVEGELAKGKRGALQQIARKLADESLEKLASQPHGNVAKRLTLKQAARQVAMMQAVSRKLGGGEAAAPFEAPAAPTARGRGPVRWIAGDPSAKIKEEDYTLGSCCAGPQPWTERDTSRHRSRRVGPNIRHPRRTVYETPKQLEGVPRGKAVRKKNTKWARDGWEERTGPSDFQTTWQQLQENGWRVRRIKRPRVKKPYAGHEVGGGSTPLGGAEGTWKESDPFVVEEFYVRPGRWGPGEKHAAKVGVDYFAAPASLYAFLRRAPNQLRHSTKLGRGAPHMHLYGL